MHKPKNLKELEMLCMDEGSSTKDANLDRHNWKRFSAVNLCRAVNAEGTDNSKTSV